MNRNNFQTDTELLEQIQRHIQATKSKIQQLQAQIQKNFKINSICTKDLTLIDLQNSSQIMDSIYQIDQFLNKNFANTVDQNDLSTEIKQKQISNKDDQNLEYENFSDLSLRLSECKSKENQFQQQKDKKIKKKRGSYRKYTLEEKREAIKLALRDRNVKKVSQKMNIPTKNLSRWIKKGIYNKRSGRKTRDPKMEQELISWINGFKQRYQSNPGSAMIKKKAKQFSNFPQNFKASKGWYEKFLYRNNKNLNSANEDDFQNIICRDEKSAEEFSHSQSVYMKI